MSTRNNIITGTHLFAERWIQMYIAVTIIASIIVVGMGILAFYFEYSGEDYDSKDNSK